MSGLLQPARPAQAAQTTLPAQSCGEDDATLARAAQTEGPAFAELYRRHVDRVYRYLLVQSGQVQEAEDLTAQTFLEALQHIGRYRGEGEFAAWLLGIARHRWLDRLRKLKHAPLPLDDSLDLPDPAPALETQVDQRLQMRDAMRALRAIAPDRSEAISLRIFGGLSMIDVATIMGKSEAAVKMLVSRGLADLRGRLKHLIEEPT